MTIEELGNAAPTWLRIAETKDADVWLDKRGRVVWHQGEFLGGEFLGSEFRGGEFLGGAFLGGAFLGGAFRGGEFRGGEFRGGEFRGGAFLGGAFRGGEVWGDTVGKTIAPQRILTLTSVDGWPKTLCAVDGVAWLKAGCHLFTLADAYRHWADREDRRETYAMLAGISGVAEQWGLRPE